MRHHHPAILQADEHRLQVGADARAAQALPGIGQEQGPVQGALDQLPAEVQELTGPPVQGCAGMGAAVAVGEDPLAPAYQEALHCTLRACELECAGAGVW